MKATRPYVMRARAEATSRTRDVILRSTYDLTVERGSVDVALADVADRAGVSVQTVLRHFGSRDGLLDAVTARAQADVAAEREAPVGDVVGAVRVLVKHYEQRGDLMLGLLAQARQDERARRIVDSGKGLHREWVATVFAPQLAAHPPRDREALLDLLVVATDLYTWALLRRDRGLARSTVQGRMVRMVTALTREER